MKLVFKAVIVADGEYGDHPTLASVAMLLESLGLCFAAPSSMDDPFVIDLAQTMKQRLIKKDI